MADRILKLKLEVDTSQTGKFAKVTQELESSLERTQSKAEKLKQLDRERQELITKQQISLAKLEATIQKLNALQEQGILNSKLAYNAANTSVLHYNKSLEQSIALQKELATQKSALSGGYSFAGKALPKEEKPTIEGQRTRNPLTGQSIETEQQKEEKIAKMREAISRTSNSILEQQTRDRLKREEEAERKSAYERIKNQSFAQRIAYTPRVGSQGSQIDITGTLSKYLKDQAKAHSEANLAAKKHKESLKALEETHKSLTQRIVEAVSIYRVYNFALNSLINGIKAIPKIGIELEATKSILTATVGQLSGASVLSALTKEAERSGIAVSTLREQFGTFSASATLAGESTETAWRIFTNLNTTITSLHLSADQAQHVFLAFSQILNKGKVQSEELVKQLGNLLPGAFATMAKALNISTQELAKRMKQGLVTAHDSLDAFAKEYAKQFSESFVIAQAGLNANVGRLQTAFTLLAESIYNKTRGGMIETVKVLRELVDGFREVIDGTSKWNTELNILKNIIEGGLFLTASNGIGKIVIAMRTAAGAAGVGALTLAMTKLKGAFSFLSVPTAIVAGILLILDRMKEVISPAETLVEKLRKAREESEALATQQLNREKLSPEAQLTFDANQTEEVKQAFQEAKSLGEKLYELQEKLKNNKFNPFFNTNDRLRTEEEIRQTKEEIRIRNEAYEKLVAQTKEKLLAEREAAKQKEAATSNEVPAKEKPIKEVNFSEEVVLQNSLVKQENERYKLQLARLKSKEEELKVQLELNKTQANPVNDKIITDKITSIQQQSLSLEEEHQARLLEIAKKSENIIVGSVKKTTISVQQAFAKIQDIESLGATNRDSAVSITGALGKSQVQPSTLSEYTEVPQRILNIEKQARFRWNKLGLKKTLTDGEKQELEKFALEHVKEINDAGAKLYEKLVNQFNGDYVKAAVAYNTGAARVQIASEAAKKAGREDFESFLPTSGKLALNKRGLAEAQGYAKKARAAIGGNNFEPTLTDQQTKQEEALGKIQQVNFERKTLASQKELENAQRLKEIKDQQNQVEIEFLNSIGKEKEAEILKINVEYAERYAQAIRNGDELGVKRLDKLKQSAIVQVQLNSLQKEYDTNERRFNENVQDLTNKSLVGRLKNFQAAQEIANLQREYIKQQETILENELKLATTEEQRIGIKDKLNQLERQKAETANFNSNYLSSNLAPERTQFENNNVNFESSRQTSLDLLNKEQEAGLISYEDFQRRKAEIEDKYIQASMVNNSIYYSSLFGMASDNFSGITKAAQQMFGEQSTAARAAFALQKTAAVGQATMQTYVAANKALAEGGPYLGPALAAIAVASGLANVATILTQPLPSGGIAHGGLENVPKEQTYLLDKGERVLSPRQNVDITNKVTNIHNKVNQNNNSTSSPNIRIVNVMDENLVYNALESDQSEKIIMNIVRRN